MIPICGSHYIDNLFFRECSHSITQYLINFNFEKYEDLYSTLSSTWLLSIGSIFLFCYSKFKARVRNMWDKRILTYTHKSVWMIVMSPTPLDLPCSKRKILAGNWFFGLKEIENWMNLYHIFCTTKQILFPKFLCLKNNQGCEAATYIRIHIHEHGLSTQELIGPYKLEVRSDTRVHQLWNFGQQPISHSSPKPSPISSDRSRKLLPFFLLRTS